MFGYFIVESKPIHYYNDGSISKSYPVERTIVQIDAYGVTWLGGDCPSELEEFKRNYEVIKEIKLED